MITVKEQTYIGWKNCKQINYTPITKNIANWLGTYVYSHKIFNAKYNSKDPFYSVKFIFIDQV